MVRLGNKPAMASTYHNLGSVTRPGKQLDEADHWYRRSMAIKKELGDQPPAGHVQARRRGHPAFAS